MRIQADMRAYISRKAYKILHSSAVKIQTGMRGMAARIELHHRKKNKASTLIQVYFWFYLGDEESTTSWCIIY